MRQCDWCDKAWEPSTQYQRLYGKTCSDHCASMLRMATKGYSTRLLYGSCQYCGRTLARKYDARRRETAWCCTAPKYQGTWCKTAYSPGLKQARTDLVATLGRIRDCDVCGARFITTAPGMKRCSPECARDYVRSYMFERDRSKREWVLHTCRQCGTQFKPIYGTKNRVYCSASCSKRGQRVLHGLRKLRVTRARRQAIYERDNWTCGICGKRVLSVAAPHPLSPTLDHILPRVEGGSDSPSNLRLAHFRCNSMRSNRGAAQLRLDLPTPQGRSNSLGAHFSAAPARQTQPHAKLGGP